MMFSNTYRRYVLCVLTIIFTLNYTDRALFALLLQPIKDDLHLSDTQLGFLTGIVFALFYATLGLPIARWADRGSRTTLSAIAIGVWGVTMLVYLWVGSFVQLVAARIAAATGESGCMPPTYSLVGDYFPAPAERTRAMGIYWLANPLAGLIGFIVGGALNARYGWRMTFFLMGIPALAMALLAKMTVVEPREMRRESHVTRSAAAPGMGSVLQTLWRQRSSRHLILAICLFFTMALGLAPWYAAFMIRLHAMGIAELGLWLGLIFSVGGAVGTVSGGFIVGRWLSQNERMQMCLSAVMVALLVPCFASFLLLRDKQHALIALCPLIVALNFVIGPTFALLQRLVRDEIRATTLAVVMLLANLIGMGIGPQLVGFASDLLRPALGNDSLRYAMLAMSFIALWAAQQFWAAGRTIEEDLRIVSDSESGRLIGATDGAPISSPLRLSQIHPKLNHERRPSG